MDGDPREMEAAQLVEFIIDTVKAGEVPRSDLIKLLSILKRKV